MRFFHFIKQHNRIGPSSYGFRKLSAFIVSDISGRRPNQAGNGIFLHILGHIQAHHIAFVVKKAFRQRLGKLGFPYPGRP